MFRLRGFGTGKHSVTEKKAPRAAQGFVQDVQKSECASHFGVCIAHKNF